jgi:TATA-box binding protein (TBP) (component of TFIID and TFIIIB)
MYNTQSIHKLQKVIQESLSLENVNIPKDIQISTMTLEAKLDTKFYPWNIYKYIKRSTDGIVKVVKENRNKVKKTCKNKNRQSDVFLNQVTVSIKVTDKKNPVSVKIFNSGTMHFTGCIHVDNLLEAVHKLCIECRKCRAIISKNRTIQEIKFAENIKNLNLKNLYDFKVDMINCIFKIPFTIDRPKLHVLLKSDNHNAVYDSNGHAAVKIKIVDKKKKITIFIFESGSIIIILGNQGFRKINEVYTFIYKYLLENYTTVVKNDELITSSILNYMETHR